VIFPNRQAHDILAGRKTQMRVPIRDPQTVTRKNGTTYQTQPFQPTLGDVISVRVRRRTDEETDDDLHRCNIVVVGYERQHLGRITFTEARAEGWRTTAEFKAGWVKQHDRQWDAKHTNDPDLTQYVERFDQRWAHTPVWAITFEVDRSAQARLMHKRSEYGYTDNPANAVDSEPEAVDRATQVRLTKEARVRDKERTNAELEEIKALPLAARLARLEELKARTDISNELRVIEQRIQRGENRRPEDQRDAA